MNRKTMALLLALSSSSGGWAQTSNVTLYGTADLGLRSTSGLSAANAPIPGSSQAVNSGILSASRWGLRGSEDLGGGLKAEFNLESAIAMDTGAQGNSARYFDRAAWLGLAGTWGRLTAGRQTNLLVDALSPIDPFSLLIASLNPNVGITALSSHGLGVGFGNSGQATSAYRLDNALKYTQRWGPLTGSLMYGFGEAEGNTSAQASTGAALRYAAGPLTLSGAIQQFRSAADRKLDAATLGAAYRVGQFSVMANIGRHQAHISDTARTTQQVFTAGAKMDVTAAVTLSAGYYRVDRERTALQGDGYRRGLLLAEYKLSPRSRVYAEADHTRWRDGYQGAGNRARATGMSLGMTHTF